MAQINCPYCNALLDPTAVNFESARIACPNCSESFPNRWINKAAGAAASGRPQTAAPSPPQTQRWSNRAVGLTIVGLMLASAAVGLAYALWSLPLRQQRHGKLPPNLVKPRQYTPATLPAIGYLPSGCNVVVGVHLAELLDNKTGQDLAAGLTPILDKLQSWTGFDAKSIDHFVVGTRLSKSKLGAFTIVIQTKRPYDVEGLRKKHASFDMLQHNGRPLFRLDRELAVDGFLWCADPGRVVLVLRIDGIQRSDMDRIPAQPRSGKDRLPSEVADVIDSSRLSPRSLLWGVGRVPEDAQLLPLFLVDKTLGELVSKAKTAVVGVSMPENTPLTIEGSIEAKDYLAATRIERLLKERNAESLKIVGPPSLEEVWYACLPTMPASGVSMAESAARFARVAGLMHRNGNWLTLQYRPDPAMIRGYLQRAAKQGRD